jgi:hypothetical protein
MSQEFRSQESGVRSQEFRSQESGVQEFRSQESGVRSSEVRRKRRKNKEGSSLLFPVPCSLFPVSK